MRLVVSDDESELVNEKELENKNVNELAIFSQENKPETSKASMKLLKKLEFCVFQYSK